MEKKIPTLLFLLLILITFLIFAKTDLIGFCSILIVTLIIYFLAQFWPSVAKILYVALSIRMLLIFLDGNFITLPDGAGDAYYFELHAYEFSKKGFPNVLYELPGFEESFFISYIIGILYSLTDRSLLMAQSISLLLGTSVVLLSWILAEKLWDKSTAMKVGWFTALFPTLILYSCILMREMYVVFFLLLALNHVVDWFHTGSIKSFCLVIVSFMAGTTFHGGVFVGLIVFVIIVLLIKIKNIFRKLFNGLISLNSLIFLVLLGTAAVYVFSSGFHIPKIGQVNDFDYIKKNLLKKNMVTHRGAAKYPSWTIAKSEGELIYKFPVRFVYLIFSPFPWDVKKKSHLVGMFDSFFYMFFVYLIFRNRKVVWADPILRTILLILFTYLIVYGISVANFGTGIRHRLKFVVMFILLAGPLLPRFNFSRKNKMKK